MNKTDTVAKPMPAPVDPPSGGTVGPIAPDSLDYPPYFIEFNGTVLGRDIPVTGPHTFTLTPPGGGRITVSLSRKAADPGRPNLSITFT
jgi:hypothetical protein